KEQHDAAAQAVSRLLFTLLRPVTRLEHVIAADFGHFAVQHEDAAGGVPGLAAEVGDAVVADDRAFHVRQADRPVAEARQPFGRLGEYLHQGRGDRVRRDREVLDADDFQLLGEVEEPDRPDAAEAGVADAVAVDLDVAQLARGDDFPAILAAGRAARDGQRDRGVAGPRHLDRAARARAGGGSVGAEDAHAAQGDAVAPRAVDFVLEDEDVDGRPADLQSAWMERHHVRRTNRA